MSANEYHFITAWRVEGTVEEVSAILGECAGPGALVAFGLFGCARDRAGRRRWHGPRSGAAHQGPPALSPALAFPSDRVAPPTWIFAGSVGRFRGTGRVELRSGRRYHEHHLRLEDPGREAPVAEAIVPDETALCMESSLGDGARRRIAAGGVDSCASSSRPARGSWAAIGGAYIVTRAAQTLIDQFADHRDEFRMHADGARADHLQSEVLG